MHRTTAPDPSATIMDAVLMREFGATALATWIVASLGTQYPELSPRARMQHCNQ